jgi:hypothetical protein
MIVGALQVLLPRNESERLVGSLSAKILYRRSSPIHRGRTTWWQWDVELPRQIRMASSSDVEITLSCWHQIVEARLLRAWMNSSITIPPMSSPVLQVVTVAPFHTTMARKKENKEQHSPAAPEKKLEPLIEEGFT